MSKLIGTNPNQVPSNADLGSAAFMDAKDFLTARGSSLSAIDAVIPKNAVDVFIYDTSLDSDGGAWRKRTQHTSWYNERLNTTTRGSRKEFPAVAVIVLEAGGSTEGTSVDLTIYDGDDPDMPMWMQYRFVIGSGSNTGISALNGIITFCATDNGVLISDFVKDRMRLHNHVHRHTYGSIAPGRLGRSTVADVLEASVTGYSIVNQTVNDVAMTVLPNAPIDAATGLPVPTIAVATNGGVSVIKDDGTVKSVSHTYGGSMKIDVDGNVLLATHNGPTSGQAAETFDLTSLTQLGDEASGPAHGDNSLNSNETYYGYGFYFNSDNSNMPFLTPNHGVTVNPIVRGNDIFFGDDLLIHIEENRQAPNYGMSNYITSTYNTGWMPGATKLATLSDTNAEDVTSAELLTNGTLGSATGWSFSGSGEYTITGGQLVDGGTQGQEFYSPYATVEIGKTYVASFEADGSGGTPTIRIVDTSSNVLNNVIVANGGGLKQYSITFTPTGSQTSVRFEGSGQAWTGYYDNFSIRLAEEDLSVNDNGLQIFGTIKKTPVAAGADLVSYSGFSASNYIHQPHNDDLSFGVGDYSVMCWFNSSLTTGAGYLFDRGDSAGHSRIAAYLQTNGNVVTYTTNSAGTVAFAAYANSYTNSVWYLYTAVRKGSHIHTYINGRRLGSFYQSQSLNNDYAPLSVGTRYNKVEGFVGSLALMRWSATSTSEEKIKKIYEDEKVLFQENAKATLYGSSNLVTALAYDDGANLLHVGTSAGRSVFQGLRRIDNTTDAVGTAISAVNGMVVEE
jgi:hypothetical protein